MSWCVLEFVFCILRISTLYMKSLCFTFHKLLILYYWYYMVLWSYFASWWETYCTTRAPLLLLWSWVALRRSSRDLVDCSTQLREPFKNYRVSQKNFKIEFVNQPASADPEPVQDSGAPLPCPFEEEVRTQYDPLWAKRMEQLRRPWVLDGLWVCRDWLVDKFYLKVFFGTPCS